MNFYFIFNKFLVNFYFIFRTLQISTQKLIKLNLQIKLILLNLHRCSCKLTKITSNMKKMCFYTIVGGKRGFHGFQYQKDTKLQYEEIT